MSITPLKQTKHYALLRHLDAGVVDKITGMSDGLEALERLRCEGYEVLWIDTVGVYCRKMKKRRYLDFVQEQQKDK